MLTARQIFSKYWITAKSLNDWRKQWIIKYKKINSRFFLYDESFFNLNEESSKKDEIILLQNSCELFHELYQKILSYEIDYSDLDKKTLSSLSKEQKFILKTIR